MAILEELHRVVGEQPRLHLGALKSCLHLGPFERAKVQAAYNHLRKHLVRVRVRVRVG